MPLRVVLVDDDRRFRRMATRALAAEGIDVVAQISDGAGAADAVEAWHPDVVLLDIRMPGVDGLEAARQLQGKADGPVVILISTSGIDEGQRLAQGLAAGYLPKDQLSLASILDLVRPLP